MRDWHLELSRGDEIGEFCKDRRAWSGFCASRSLDPILRGGRVVRGGIDALRFDAEFEGEFDVAVAVEVEERFDSFRRHGPDPIREAVSVSNRDDVMSGQPSWLCSPATPMTLAPLRRASCTAMDPTRLRLRR